LCHDTLDTRFLAVVFEPASKELYRNVLDRVNLADPENSLLLRKGNGEAHGGGIRLNVTTYNTILNWIRSGAPCGTNPAYC
jgi:hypothetical protein